MKLLLHTCCGPCASACIERLRAEGFEVTMFFSNSNIAPREEYERRLESAKLLAQKVGVSLVEDPADHGAWLSSVAADFENEPEGGARCGRCFAFSFERTAAYMAKNGFDFWTTSLTVSPYKNSARIFEIAEKVGGFLKRDFKKQDGYLLSCRLAKEYGLYRQNYCGCEFSLAARLKSREF